MLRVIAALGVFADSITTGVAPWGHPLFCAIAGIANNSIKKAANILLIIQAPKGSPSPKGEQVYRGEGLKIPRY
jgi:hypothetical protein